MVFCSELKVARQLQLFRGLFPVLPPNLKGANVEDSALFSSDGAYSLVMHMPDLASLTNQPPRPTQSIDPSRAVPEAIRTAKEIGWVKAGDKVVVSNYEQWDDHSIKQSMNLRCLQVT